VPASSTPMRRVYPAASAQRSVVSRRLTFSVMGEILAQNRADGAGRQAAAGLANQIRLFGMTNHPPTGYPCPVSTERTKAVDPERQFSANSGR
jgi:hypothetical protein